MLKKNVLGDVGEWVASCVGADGKPATGPPSLSFRHPRFGSSDLAKWRAEARFKFTQALLMPQLAPIRESATASVEVGRVYIDEGVRVEEVSWQLPFGGRTQAVYMTPADHQPGSSPPLPAVLCCHCHGGQKLFGFEKITKTRAQPQPQPQEQEQEQEQQHPAMVEHQKTYYSGRAWANDLARRGYAVLAHDTFPFGSRRQKQQLMPDTMSESCSPLEYQTAERDAAACRRNLDEDRRAAAAEAERSSAGSSSDAPEAAEAAAAAAEEAFADSEYNRWASEHEHVIAKSLLSAGLSWPGVLLAEDTAALDVLLSRPGVDVSRVGCCGLSGGGLRTMLLGASDSRIGPTVQVGYFTTSKDMVLNKSYGHSWQGHIPSLARELDLSDLVSMRCPLPVMVQHTREDALFTLASAEEGLAGVSESFAKADYAANFVPSIYDGPHCFSETMQSDAWAFLDKWLLPIGADTPLAFLHKQVQDSKQSEVLRLQTERTELDRRIRELQSN